MADFPPANRDAIEANYRSCVAWTENLEQSNECRESDIRTEYIQELNACEAEIASSGFFERSDFNQDEQDRVLASSNQIALITSNIKDENDLTLIHLETTLADLVQRIPLDSFFWALRLSWLKARRHYSKLPKDIPDEVVDTFNVGVFVRVQWQLNRRADAVRPILREECLNQDDFSPTWFNNVQRNSALSSGTMVVDEYLDLLATKAALQAAEELARKQTPSIAGQIWSFIGWDDPWDFAKDMALAAVTGGASKAVRWARKLNAVRKRIEKAKKLTQKLTKLADNIAEAERKIDKVRDTAAKIKALKALMKWPERLKAAFALLNDAQEQQKLLTQAGTRFRQDYIRGVATSVLGNLAGGQQSTSVPKQASYEAARTSIMLFLENDTPFSRIQELRDIIGWKSLFSRQLRADQDALIGEYLWLLWLEEFLVRLLLKVVHQSGLAGKTLTATTSLSLAPLLNRKMLTDEAIAAAGAAIERLIRDELPFIPYTINQQVSRFVMSFVRKTLVKFLQSLVDLILK